jgi:cell division protein ZapA
MSAVNHVDREMTAIRDAGRVKARERIAVLAALNLAYALAERPASAPGARVAGLDIDTLVHRLDQALGADGQLL